jgi:hypothetical protein
MSCNDVSLMDCCYHPVTREPRGIRSWQPVPAILGPTGQGAVSLSELADGWRAGIRRVVNIAISAIKLAGLNQVITQPR